MKYGIQLYSCRDAVKANMEDTLKRLSEIGYKKVETAGLFDHTPEEVRAMLDKYGLEATSTHTAWESLANNFDETVRLHKIIGANTVIIPGFDYYSCRENLDNMIEFMNYIQPKLKAEGLALAYHNHSDEFLPTDYGAYVHKELEEKTTVDFEIDTYWAFNAGVNPIETLERLKDRVHFVHIKDGFLGGKGVPLGRGEAPVAEVYAKALELGMQLVVESETQDPDGITEADICFKFLKAQEK